MNNTFQAFHKDARIYKRYRKLPHWEQPGCTYFVTFRLADSLPQKQLDFLTEDRQHWFKEHPRPWTEHEYEQYQREFTVRVENGWITVMDHVSYDNRQLQRKLSNHYITLMETDTYWMNTP